MAARTTMLKIDAKHRLVGPQVGWQATPNVGGRLVPRWLVLHYTAGSSAASAVASLCTHKPSGNCSAHAVLARDGTITQLAPFNVVTWHAGVSQWDGVVGLNNASIGIEIDNAGALNAVGEKYVTWYGREVPAAQVMLAAHRHGGPVRPWHAYTPEQIERCIELAELLVQRYGLQAVLGHDDIARGRKLDPGPAFPLSSIASRVLGREDDAPALYAVTSPTLNIRQAPDAAAPLVAPALARGTRVELLEPGSRWSRVEVVDADDVEGWVNNRFIERVAEPRKAPPRALRRGAPKRPRKAPRRGR
jgi:N-acetylmuramoyl-L-alanine amidase